VVLEGVAGGVSVRGGVLICAAFLGLLGSGCPDPCDNDQPIETFSPSGKWKVIVFRRGCGATTGFSTHVSLVPRGESLPKAPGNLLVVDDGRGSAKVDAASRIHIDVTFDGDAVVTLSRLAGLGSS
jgi:hypothetical protein